MAKEAQGNIEKIREAKVDMAIKAAVFTKGKEDEEEVIELRKQILSIPELYYCEGE